MIAAEYDLKGAEAALADLEVTIEDGKFDRQASAAEIASDYADAKIKAERDRRLVEQGLIPQLDARLSANLAEQLGRRYQIEEQRVGIRDRSAATQLAAQKVKIDQFRAIYEVKRQEVAGLHVVAGVSGMLEQLGNAAVTNPSGATTPLEVGQNVAAGAILARVAGQDRLKAQIRISETEAKDIAVGQAATIDTRNGLIAGRVARIDPAAVNGTVLVDVSLTGPLTPGARPDLSVDGTIDIERLENVTYMGRPGAGQPGSSITLFRLDADGRTATRVPVKLGRASVNTVEVVSGLRAGDRVILSDMSAMDSHDRIRIN
jgi:HlyD family secretion protein